MAELSANLDGLSLAKWTGLPWKCWEFSFSGDEERAPRLYSISAVNLPSTSFKVNLAALVSLTRSKVNESP